MEKNCDYSIKNPINDLCTHFTAKPTFMSDYLTDHHVHKLRLSWQVPPCATGCSRTWLGDGFCDRACNTTLCLYDGGDCLEEEDEKKSNEKSKIVVGKGRSQWPKRPSEMGILRQNPAAQQALIRALERGKHVDECSRDCNGSWLADGSCDPSCQNAACGYDLGDCEFESTKKLMQIQNFDSKCAQTVSNEYRFDASKPVLALNFTDYMNNCVNASASSNQTASGVDKSKNLILINASCLSPNVHTTTFDSERKLLMLLISNQKFQGQLDVYLEVMLQKQLKSWNLQLIVNYNPIKTGKKVIRSHRNKSSEKPVGAGRKLLDLYLDTLLHVDYLFNRHFKIISRKVPPHIPMLIDKQVMERLQETFQDEFEKTSSHRFRHSNDMQYGFSYYHFLMQETRTLDADEILRKLDTNEDG